MLFRWDDSYSLNIPSIDQQHQYLVSILNKVYDIAVEERDSDELQQVFKELMAYIKKHFDYEEELFEAYHYPSMDDHVKLHRDITKKVMDFYQDYSITKNVDIKDFLAFMVEWLQDHILVEDKRYSLFLIGKGVM